MPELDGKVIVVTGAGSGMGKSITILFAGDGTNSINGTIITTKAGWTLY